MSTSTAEAPKSEANLESGLEPVTTSSLEALQNIEQRTVLNIVDNLRQCGLEGILSLPQIVVCGDQSSGKSSVLEAITEIPFPRRENLCTRFATEIVLRRAATTSIQTKIIPEESRPASEQAALKAFNETITDFSQLPVLMDKATELMGLSQTSNGSQRAFAADVLSIEISGPDRPQLTLVDLPGLIHSATKGQKEDDVKLVEDLVDKYISEPRTIILAVISAKNDYANQVILKKARKVDSEGNRTLGIITKPDELHAGSENETAFVSLAKNDDIFFKLGWHVLKNRGYDSRESSFSARNETEREFFHHRVWKNMDSNMLGIETLRIRLSDLLFKHIKDELPKLRTELENMYVGNLQDLKKLGAKRSTEHEQREYMMQLSLRFRDLAKAAVNGHYEQDYFDKAELLSVSKNKLSGRRLRAIVQLLNIEYSGSIFKVGSKFKLHRFDNEHDDPGSGVTAPSPVPANTVESDAEDSGSGEEDASPTSTLVPRPLGKRETLSWVQEVLSRTRGQELPGNFNPLLIGELFWEQSSNWFEYAVEHIEDVSELCTNFVLELLQKTCSEDVYARIKTNFIDDALKVRLDSGREELAKIWKDQKRHPMTYNHYYTMTVQKSRSKQIEEALQKSLKNATVNKNARLAGYNDYRDIEVTDHSQVLSSFQAQMTANMDEFSCQDALACLDAYYKVALKTFVDNTCTQVVERHIVDGLESVFSPLTVSSWTAEELSLLASEPETIKRQREHLENRRSMLERGRKVFRKILRKAK